MTEDEKIEEVTGDTLEVDTSYPDGIGASLEEKRRAFVLEMLGDGSVDPWLLAENCGVLVSWLKNGIVPERPVVETIKRVKAPK